MDLLMKGGESRRIHGYPVQTYFRGELVYDTGRIYKKAGSGEVPSM